MSIFVNSTVLVKFRLLCLDNLNYVIFLVMLCGYILFIIMCFFL